MSYKPRIGLTTYWQEISWGIWPQRPAAIVPGKYVRAVADAGGTSLLLPMLGSDPTVLEILDGLIVIGGVDVDPALYGQEPHPKTDPPQPDRDQHDIALTREAVRRGVPLLTICRGVQILNVAHGGTLNQHIPDIVPGAQERNQPEPGVYGSTSFNPKRGTLSHELLGDSVTAACYHHQSIAELGEPLRATARSADGTVQMVEMPEAPGWVLGVQFHPEENPEDKRIFTALVRQATEYAARRESARTKRTSPLNLGN